MNRQQTVLLRIGKIVLSVSALIILAERIDAQESFLRPFDDTTFSDALKEQEQKRAEMAEAIDANRAYRESKFGVLPDDAPEDVKSAYAKSLSSFREGVKSLRRAYTEYNLSAIDGKDEARVEKWSEALRLSHQGARQWIDHMADIYVSDPSKYKDLGLTLMEIIRGEATADRVENLLKAAHAVFENPPDQLDAALINGIAFTGYANGDFELARKAWEQYKSEAELPVNSEWYFSSLDRAEEKWQRELEQRELDKTRNNPRVQLMTTKGLLTIELFEDSAPEAVANFIYLADRSFYKSLKFHRVLPQFCLQTGCKAGDGTTNAGYTITSESTKENRRDVFRGSVFFALGVDEQTGNLDEDTASSQFIIASAMLPQMNSNVTVFGRVVEGEHSLGIFRKVDLSEKEQKEDTTLEVDLLINTKVLNRRDHEYIPTAVRGKLPF